MATSLTLDPILNIPKPYKIVIGVVLLAAVGVAAYLLVFAPALERIAKLDAELKTVQTEIAQDRATLAQLELARKKAAALEVTLALLTEKLPTDKDMPALYRTVSDAALQSGLDVPLFQPREPRTHDYYNEIPITLSAEGGYHDIARFLDRLSGMPRVVNVAEWKLTAVARQTAPVRADLTLATYMYRPVGAPAAKPGVKK